MILNDSLVEPLVEVGRASGRRADVPIARLGYNVTEATNLPHTVEIVANQMVVLDEAITETAPGGMGFNS